VKSLGNFPDPFRAEIAGQPDAIRRAAASLPLQREAFGGLADAARRARTIVLTGMGSSYDALYPCVAALAARGVPAVMVDAAELIHFRRGLLDADALVVAVSQSGESAEVVRLAEDVAEASRPTIVSVTNDLANTLAVRADIALDTLAGSELGPSTMTFAASLVVLAAVTRVMAGEPVERAVADVRAEAERAAAAGERLLDDDGLPGRVEGWLGRRSVIVLLGRGPARAAAEMGSLTLKEAAGLPAESLQTAQFRHGPLELAGPDLAAIVVATEPQTHDLDVGLAAELLSAGAAVLLVTADGDGPSGVLRVGIGSLGSMLSPAIAIVPAQLLAWRLAIERGRSPGSFTRASKVTTHE
jgi:glucosamine--fructose-6-phosphate aminotransferase (isomerizing)